MRIATEVLDELIEHGGQCKHWPLNAEGVLKLALDLREARARIAELEQEVTDLNGLADGISTDLKAIRSKLVTKPPEPTALEAFETIYTPSGRRRHRKRAIKT